MSPYPSFPSEDVLSFDWLNLVVVTLRRFLGIWETSSSQMIEFYLLEVLGLFGLLGLHLFRPCLDHGHRCLWDINQLSLFVSFYSINLFVYVCVYISLSFFLCLSVCLSPLLPVSHSRCLSLSLPQTHAQITALPHFIVILLLLESLKQHFFKTSTA